MKFEDLTLEEKVILLEQQGKDLAQLEEKSRLKCIELEKQVEALLTKDEANDAAIALYNVVHDIVRISLHPGPSRENGGLEFKYIPTKGTEA